MRRTLKIGSPVNAGSVLQSIPGSSSAERFKMHIERLACLIGLGIATPSTVPAEEIEQAQALLLRIGIAVPKTARTRGCKPETGQACGSPSKVQKTSSADTAPNGVSARRQDSGRPPAREASMAFRDGHRGG